MFGQRKVQSDPRVSKILDSLKIKYDVDDDGDYRAVFELEDGRSQLAFIDSRTSQLGAFEIRDVWSIGYSSEEPLDKDLANYLLLQNANLKIGAWELRHVSTNKFLTVFCTKVAADCESEALYASLVVVLNAADGLEKNLDIGDYF
ncbi:hypothetical protein L3556_10455 [Candidatus Synechococcus calcipolaris G9]|uniref:YbjN domain-containing protein n=1 Tax=Candidatus Synechococcus calcipolaris G9 TaxID=1497997 RepID=A0ABT6F0I4_9SYNE|nr:hypothetical protein [Candidatus Synechococcus calcipolaris]MDG2991347.1 hypothetical protein [Candidatus Synechococcus calcipolaris G9]